MQTNSGNLLQEITDLLVENAHVKAQFLNQLDINALQHKQLQALQLTIANNSAAVSNSDNKTFEVELLQNYMEEMENKATGAVEREIKLRQELVKEVSNHHQMEDLQQQYIYLEIKYTDIEFQLQTANARILYLQQQANQFVKQEILSAANTNEKDKWKFPFVKNKNSINPLLK